MAGPAGPPTTALYHCSKMRRFELGSWDKQTDRQTDRRTDGLTVDRSMLLMSCTAGPRCQSSCVIGCTGLLYEIAHKYVIVYVFKPFQNCECLREIFIPQVSAF